MGTGVPEATSKGRKTSHRPRALQNSLGTAALVWKETLILNEKHFHVLQRQTVLSVSPGCSRWIARIRTVCLYRNLLQHKQLGVLTNPSSFTIAQQKMDKY